jgi:hypothetical protein
LSPSLLLFLDVCSDCLVITDQRTKLFKKVARRQLQGVVQFEYIGK